MAGMGSAAEPRDASDQQLVYGLSVIWVEVEIAERVFLG